jgi:hypothetical protein
MSTPRRDQDPSQPVAKTGSRIVGALTLSAAFAIHAQAAPLAVGTEIGVDFGNDPLPSNNFNAPAFVQTGSIAAGGIIDTTGATVDGVGFSWTSNNNLFASSSGGNVTAGDPAVFNSSNTDDWYGVSNLGTPGTITLTFSGLDDAFSYDLVIGSAGGNGGNADTTWTADGQSFTTDADATDGSAYVTLSGLSTDGSGNLVITGDGAGARTDIPVVSALHLTATDGTPPPTGEDLAVGTVIGVDFGAADGTSASSNWNDVAVITSGSLAAGTMIDTSGVGVNGVAFSWDGRDR